MPWRSMFLCREEVCLRAVEKYGFMPWKSMFLRRGRIDLCRERVGLCVEK